MSLFGDILGSVADGFAKKKANKKQAKLIDKNTALMGAEFDYRDRIAQESDARTSALIDREYKTTSGLADETFSYLLGQNQTGFDEQQTVAKKAFDSQMDAYGGLMTAKRAARLEQIDASERERARQMAFQAQADDLAAALPGQIGFESQEANRSAAFDRRSAFIAKNTTVPQSAPAFANDERLAGAYAGAAQGGVQEGIGDALGSAKISSYRDAYMDAERDISEFGSEVNQLTNKAQISRSALPAELAVGEARKNAAQTDYDWTVDIAKGLADRDSTRLSNYRDALTGSQQTYADAMGRSFDNYFGRMFGTEGSFTERLLNSSLNKENRTLSLRNQQIQSVRPNTLLGDIIRMTDKAASSGAKAAAGGG